MEEAIKQRNIALNKIAKRLDEQYHAYAVYAKLSDPALWTLYALYEAEEQVTQNELATMWCYPKQTVNFTISGLVKKGYVELKQLSGARNSKAVCLTEEGKGFCKKDILPLVEAEERSLKRLSPEERELLVRLSEKQCAYFEEEIRNITHVSEK